MVLFATISSFIDETSADALSKENGMSENFVSRHTVPVKQHTLWRHMYGDAITFRKPTSFIVPRCSVISCESIRIAFENLEEK